MKPIVEIKAHPSAQQLADWLALAEKATPGPWTIEEQPEAWFDAEGAECWQDKPDYPCSGWGTCDLDKDECPGHEVEYPPLAEVAGPRHYFPMGQESGYFLGQADSEFLAAAREGWPATIRTLRKERQQHETAAALLAEKERELADARIVAVEARMHLPAMTNQRNAIGTRCTDLEEQLVVSQGYSLGQAMTAAALGSPPERLYSVVRKNRTTEGMKPIAEIKAEVQVWLSQHSEKEWLAKHYSFGPINHFEVDISTGVLIRDLLAVLEASETECQKAQEDEKEWRPMYKKRFDELNAELTEAQAVLALLPKSLVLVARECLKRNSG